MELNFDAPGPVGEAFMDSHCIVNSIMGPVGSAKTSCLMMKTIKNSARQKRSKIDGVRYSKAIFVRETFRQLYTTTIPSWWQWMPKKSGEWKGGGNEQGQHHLRFRLLDQSIVDLRVIFAALGDNNVEDLMRGWEFNLLNLNEGDGLPSGVLSHGLIRISQGRYPGEKHVDPTECVKEVNIDYNAPDVENYLYKMNEETQPEGYAFFRQPGGLDPKAENRLRATTESYQQMERDLIAQGRPDLARRMIHNQYGYTRDGDPVYPEYRDDFHCAMAELKPVIGLPVFVDLDQGLHPAALFRQSLPNGQMVILDELYSDAGAVDLCDQIKRLAGSEKYRMVRVIGGKGDPMIVVRSGNDAESWVDCVNRLMGWRGGDMARPAATNNPDKRQAAVRYRLRTNVGDGRPALLISSACKVLRKGFNSLYRFKKKPGGGRHDQPDKNFPVADVHDALQYGALDNGGYEEVVGRVARSKSFGRTYQARMEVTL